MQNYTIVVYPFEENAYILYDESSKDAAVIDPGGSVREIENFLDKKSLELKYILLTHGHVDHISGVDELLKKHDVSTVISSNEKKLLQDSTLNLTSRYGLNSPKINNLQEVKDGDAITLGNEILKFIETPGHTRGSMCIFTDNKLFSGDTLFQGSIGRTDLPTGSFDMMNTSLKKLSKLDDTIEVYPGHGQPTTIGIEKRTNPFMQGL
ncbi:MBL fold metallo-hydrolase [Criibacterium bergeronii]|uniref:MBL fold metallo-hydrolase n=1 Tax=Criibacterium bergeronii TaxID=1871336 RepID=A0A552VCW6_9FIRM|nr:MBL fold metallo-hydrolase [Criibacterium bergeronii]MBS6062947.1 MBL fold metallo-hydrolase [Peptostreptococcaceae bacterium]TRW28259.1 MBL fold metallo-hydrolase [Criibacterium bergeronii]